MITSQKNDQATKNKYGSRKTISRFTKGQSHSDVARQLYGKAVGAGFCTIAAKADSPMANVHCYGRSISLGIDSRKEDEEVINKNINCHGY